MSAWNWDNLRFCLALAKHGTLSRAGEELEVSHTTVLRRIRALEHTLGTHLFDQTPTGYRLTTTGAILVERIGDLEATISAMAREISADDQQVSGRVVITAPDTLGFSVLPTILAELHAQQPELQLSLRVSNERLDIEQREADIAIRACRNPPPNLIGRQVGEVEFLACCTAQYADRTGIDRFPLSTQGHHFIVPDGEFAGTPFDRWWQTWVPEVDVCTRVDGLYAASRLCCTGLGITVLPSYMVEDSTLQVLPTDEQIASNELWVLSHRDLRGTLRVRIAKDFLQVALAERFGLP